MRHPKVSQLKIQLNTDSLQLLSKPEELKTERTRKFAPLFYNFPKQLQKKRPILSITQTNLDEKKDDLRTMKRGKLRFLREVTIGITNKNFKIIRKENLSSVFMLKYFKSLRRVFINLSDCDFVSNRTLNELKHALKDLKSLKFLKAEFANCKEITDLGLMSFKQGFSSLNKMVSISFNFNACTQISDSGLFILNQGFKKLTKLTNFSLNVGQLEDITNLSCNSLMVSFGSFSLLEKLNLDISCCHEIRGTGLGYLGQGLLGLQGLKSLALNLDSCSNVTQEGIDYLTACLPNLVFHLESFHLSLNDTELGEQGLNFVSYRLRQLYFLKTLSLQFSQPEKMTDLQMGFLGQSIKNLTLLQSLTLKFNDCLNITDDGVRSLCDGFAGSYALRKLDISFTDCICVSDAGLCYLASTIASVELNDLTIRVLGSSDITSEGVRYLRSQVQNLACLESLILEFSALNEDGTGTEDIDVETGNTEFGGFTNLKSLELKIACPNLIGGFLYPNGEMGCLPSLKRLVIELDGTLHQESEFNLIKSCVKKLRELEALSISFKNATSINDEWLKELALSLRAIRGLKQLSLKIENCKELTQNGMIYITDSIRRFKSLQQLSIYLSRLSIPNEALYVFAKGIKEMKPLEVINLGITYCNNISDHGLKYLKDGLVQNKTIKSLVLHTCDSPTITKRGFKYLLHNPKFPITICLH